jgi:hypothetical protein
MPSVSSSTADKDFLISWVSSNPDKLLKPTHVSFYWTSGKKPDHWKRIHKQTNPDGTTVRAYTLDHGKIKIQDRNPLTTEVYDLPNEVAVITHSPLSTPPSLSWISYQDAFNLYLDPKLK